MAHALILACGNPLRGDDAVALQIAEALQIGHSWPDMKVEAAHQLLPEMAEAISEAEIVIFVDASASATPGSVLFEPILPSRLTPETFTHDLNPRALLALAQALYGKSPAHAFTLNIGAESFELREGLSETVSASIPEAVHTILEYLTHHFSLARYKSPTLIA
jgi:hydrogenase maturation protease